MYLQKENQSALALLLSSSLWVDVERCMKERYPEQPDVKDPSHIAAAKGHKRAGFEWYAAELRKLPIESPPDQASAFDRPALTITED